MTRTRVTLGDALDVLIDHRGKTPKKLGGDWSTEGHRVVSALNIKGSRVDENDHHYISPEMYAKWMKVPLDAGDVLLTSEAPTGEVAYLPERPDWALGQRLFGLRGKRGVLDGRYLYYALRGGDARHQLISRATGTTVSGIRQSELVKVELDLPPVEEQRAIAASLGALDDKIESNRRLVQLLLQRAALEFEARFGAHETELPLGDLCSVVDCLHSKKPERVEHGKRLLQLNNIRDDGLIDRSEYFGISDDDYANWARKFETREWDLVITNVGRIGAVGRVPAGLSAALGRNMTGVRPLNSANDGPFVAVALLSPAVRREIELNTDSGTIMNALNVRSIPDLRLQSANHDERAQFSQFARSFLQAADQALLQTSHLAATRDALLPELLSGRIRVPEAAAVVQDG